MALSVRSGNAPRGRQRRSSSAASASSSSRASSTRDRVGSRSHGDVEPRRVESIVVVGFGHLLAKRPPRARAAPPPQRRSRELRHERPRPRPVARMRRRVVREAAGHVPLARRARGGGPDDATRLAAVRRWKVGDTSGAGEGPRRARQSPIDPGGHDRRTRESREDLRRLRGVPTFLKKPFAPCDSIPSRGRGRSGAPGATPRVLRAPSARRSAAPCRGPRVRWIGLCDERVAVIVGGGAGGAGADERAHRARARS